MRLGIAELHAHRDKPQAGPEGRINAPESVQYLPKQFFPPPKVI